MTSVLVVIAFLGFLFIIRKLLVSLQNKIIFPSFRLNLVKYQQLNKFSLPIKDSHLTQGWLLPANRPESTNMILYFSGNAEDSAFTFDQLVKLDVASCYAFHYRGYGLSDGIISEEGLYHDAIKIYDFLKEKYPDKSIIVVGRSLGTAFASYLACQRKVAALILLSPFDSMKSLARYHFGRLLTVVKLKYEFELVAFAKRISEPTLVIIADRDLVIPANCSNRYYEALSSLKTIKIIPNTGHNDLLENDKTILLINCSLNGSCS